MQKTWISTFKWRNLNGYWRYARYSTSFVIVDIKWKILKCHLILTRLAQFKKILILKFWQRPGARHQLSTVYQSLNSPELLRKHLALPLKHASFLWPNNFTLNYVLKITRQNCSHYQNNDSNLSYSSALKWINCSVYTRDPAQPGNERAVPNWTWMSQIAEELIWWVLI